MIMACYDNDDDDDPNSPGEYKFGEANPVTAHVVFVRGQPLGIIYSFYHCIM